MTVMTRVPGRPDWAAGPLYALMLDIFPTYRTKLGVLDVLRMRNELSRSHEAIYKWLRQGKVTGDNARRLIGLASAEENLAALKEAGRKPPTMEDFLPFL